MIYEAPNLTERDTQILEGIQALRDDMQFYLGAPRRWYGTLSRVMMARAVQASTSIEGYHSTVDETAAIIEGEKPLDVDEDTRMAVSGYRDAMTYVMRLTGPSRNEEPRMDASLLKSLHFIMVGHDLSTNPGQWRSGAVWVRDGTGNPVYEAPDRDDVETLIDELIAQVNDRANPALIAAAMAHLNLTLIHPFGDGNGRMARCLQSFVLGSAFGALSPVFTSIEEYLGRNTAAYYAALTETAAGSWSPERSARPWIEFCLTAHYRQAATVRRRIDLFEARWDRCEQIVARSRLPGRVIDALMHSAQGWSLKRSLYMRIVRSATGEEISDAMATRDLAAMAAAGLLEPVGEKRGRHYRPSESLIALEQEIRAVQPARPVLDPYEASPPQRNELL